ncbi:hypothetical protein [Flavobacterium sp. GT3R68]|nr:hypothetical protein [Flavobacterium sp. GT3R68]
MNFGLKEQQVINLLQSQ